MIEEKIRGDNITGLARSIPTCSHSHISEGARGCESNRSDYTHTHTERERERRGERERERERGPKCAMIHTHKVGTRFLKSPHIVGLFCPVVGLF
jgi:hypothetical protein